MFRVPKGLPYIFEFYFYFLVCHWLNRLHVARERRCKCLSPPSRAHRHALQYTESLRPRILTSVFAAFYVIHGHSPYAYAGKFTAWSKKVHNLLELICTDLGRDKPSRKLRNLCDFSYSFPLRWWKLSKHQSRNNREKNILPAAMNFNILFMFFICPKEYLLIPTFITLLKVVI